MSMVFKPLISKRSLSQGEATSPLAKKAKPDPILKQWQKIGADAHCKESYIRGWFAEKCYSMDAADEEASTKFGRDIAEQFYKYGIDLDRRDGETRDTPLLLAAKHGNPVLVACLLALGASKYTKTTDSKTLRQIVCTEIISPTYIAQLPSYKHNTVNIKHYTTGEAYACQDPEFPPYKQILDILTQAGCFE